MRFTTTQLNYINEGMNQDSKLRILIRQQLGLATGKVTAKRNTMVSGPPGVGKSFSVMDELNKHGANFLQFGAGASDSAIALQLAHTVANLPPTEYANVLFDDSDDVIVRDYEAANKWKQALQKHNPFLSLEVNLTSQRIQYEKSGRMDLVHAIDAFSKPGSVGIQIPTDRIRFFIICNRNCEDKSQFKGKMWSAVEAIVDRVKYRRLNFEWRVSWGWLAYILQNSQPFENHPLDDEQKQELLSWMWSNWEAMRNQSYRTVEEMAEYMINDPADYVDQWDSAFLRKD